VVLTKKTRHPFSTSARLRAAERCDVQTPRVANNNRLVPFSSRPSPASEGLNLRLCDHLHGVEVESVEGLSLGQTRFGKMPGDAPLTSVGEFLLDGRGEEARGVRAFFVCGGGKRATDEFDAG